MIDIVTKIDLKFAILEKEYDDKSDVIAKSQMLDRIRSLIFKKIEIIELRNQINDLSKELRSPNNYDVMADIMSLSGRLNDAKKSLDNELQGV